MSITNIVPDKLEKQLHEAIKDKLVAEYTCAFSIQHDYRTQPAFISASYNNYRNIAERSTSVIKYVRPMELRDLYNQNRTTEEKLLERLFDVEKKLEKLQELERSVNSIKNIFK